jgi:hypothetical protein
MKSLKLVRYVLLLFAAAGAFAQTKPQSPNPKQAENDELLKKGRAAYYSLKTEGMTGFTCALTPNWTAMLKTQGVVDPAVLGPAVDKLSRLRFTVVVDGKGAAKVAHNEVSAENAKVAEGMKQIYEGMEQMTTGFFQTWSVFVVDPPLPEPGTEIEVEIGAAQYAIKYNEGATVVKISMGKDYAVNSMQATTTDFDSMIRPVFSKSPKGLLMNGYNAKYEGAGGKDKTDLQVALEYQDVAGFKLPLKLDLKGSYDGSPFQVEVAFSGCSATK